ncbi:FAD/NAD(P)-binding domain-containing protein [Saitoella complicata NRRL Y-17804]|nr:FAD/NAD(P)-binding domain-containing protein [Saitoella complicata NRRL Y-17804]ODQ53367.1 FAD/NAD(P)-binding domain-containing protein [Saitoella complicata NRRL Y-17804]
MSSEAGLQQFRVGYADEIKDMQKKEVTIGGEQKVLLMKVKGKIYATAPKCTHYGAPLKNGVLSPDGRLVCPWHGACFRVDTGDIEDAPALDALKTYPVTIKDNEIFISATQESLTQNQHPPTFIAKGAKDPSKHLVVVGGGSGATGVVEGSRSFGYPGKITVVSKETYLPIDRTKLSKALITDEGKVALRSSDFFKDLDIEIKLGSTVKAVDPSGHTITLENGESLSYTTLVLATGGIPKRLPMYGFNASNVYTLRYIQDADAITKALGDAEKEKKKVVIVGSSFIGMELAGCISGKGHDVTVIGMESSPLETILGPKVGKFIQGLHTEKGVKFELGKEVEKAETSGNKATAVLLKDGTSIPADVVILGVGVAPATKFLESSSAFNLRKDGGVEVDEFLRVKGVEDVYAIGDIAAFPYIGHTGKAKGDPIRIEHWDVAMNHGRTVARHISSPFSKEFPEPKPFTNVPYFWSAQGVQVRYCGNTQGGFDDIVYQGSFEDKKWAAFYCQGEEVVAVCSVGYDPVVSKAAELMRVGGMPAKKELADGVDVRKVEIPHGVADLKLE